MSVSYLRIPAADPPRLAQFYAAVFGWTTRDAAFTDARGQVIGHFSNEHAVAGEAGIRPYIEVENVDETLVRAHEHGGMVVTEPYAEGDLRVAVLRDPEENVIGVWQRP